MDKTRKITPRDLLALARQGEKIVTITAYDATMARLAEAAGVQLLLVGDSMGNAILGHANTLAVTLAQSLHHTAAVVRGARQAMVIGDMPFMSYHGSQDDAVLNAGRYLQEAGADGIKLEGGEAMAPLIARMVQAGIPVMGHIGLLPQRVLVDSGYRIKGRAGAEAKRLIADAQALQEAGAFAIVLEGMVSEVARQVTEAIKIPTIGIGAGPHCSGQIQVITDLLGLDENFLPKHSRRYANLAETIRTAINCYGEDVRAGRFPGPDQSF